ncbi:MAG: hypothetical protein AAFQ37_08565 [Bacteroidota bacterium]
MGAQDSRWNRLTSGLLLVWVLLGCFGEGLNAQNLGRPNILNWGVHDPMRIPGRVVAIDFELGVNVNLLKIPRVEEAAIGNFKPGLGYAIGTSVLLFPRNSVSFIFGARYLFDRGWMEEFSIGQYEDPNSNIDRRPIRERIGEVPVRDKSWRIEFMMRFKVVSKAYFLFGFQGSHINGGKQVFEYEETLYRVYNPLSFQYHELPTPIVSSGNEVLQRAKRQGGVLLGLEFHPGRHLFGRLLWDISEASGSGGANLNNKQNFERLTLSLGYRL